MPDQSVAVDQRAERRSSLFVIAALYVAGKATPIEVRIRNLSPSGALIEGSGFPRVGTAVRLTRASLSATGELLWTDEAHAGLHFACPVQVADWLPGGARDSGQQRVDALLLEARSAPARSAAHGAPPAPSRPDYAAIAQSLAEAGEALLADPAVAERHLAALQAIDIAAQALDQLAGGQ